MTNKLKVKTLVSLDEFEKNSQRWNTLWESSEAYEAVTRCEGISLWVRSFGKSEDFRAVVVESPAGDLLGGIAFMVQSSCGLKKLTLTVNQWINCGELLISKAADSEAVISLIVEQLEREGDFLEFDLSLIHI